MSRTQIISGPAGNLELAIDLPPPGQERRAIAVCCHPHPQHGGALTNKVIHTVARTLAGLGIVSIRFNFRGVGRSDGDYDSGRGEGEDLRAVVDWAREQYPDRELWLAGFSFGSWVAALASDALGCGQLISVAPPAGRFDFADFPGPGCPWLVVMGDADEVVEPQAVFDWLESLAAGPELIVMEQAGHFFHGRLVELRERLEAALAPQVPALIKDET